MYTPYYFAAGCTEQPQNGTNSALLCRKPAGYKVTYDCTSDLGLKPGRVASTCQEDGTWEPDTVRCTGKLSIIIPHFQ